ncbi:G-patch domain [Sesbania bispinosa]|nr:G-patch domain [Sesbania bispinosa]
MVDHAAMDVFAQHETQGLNPVPAILADTLLSLEVCQKKNEGVLKCCTHLLYVWIITHMYACELRTLFPDPLRDFGRIKVKRQEAREWKKELADIQDNKIAWTCPWYSPYEVIFSCGDFANVPLMGPRGYVAYTPSIALRQLKRTQVKPVEEQLGGIYFQYDVPDASQLLVRVRAAWRNVQRKGDDELGKPRISASQEYNEWRKAKGVPEYVLREAPHAEGSSRSSDETLKAMAFELERARVQIKQLEEVEEAAEWEIDALKRQCKKKDEQIERLKIQGEDEAIEGWRLRTNVQRDKKREWMKRCDDMADCVNYHSIELAWRLGEAEDEIDRNPEIQLPPKTARFMRYCQDLARGFGREPKCLIQTTNETSAPPPPFPTFMPYPFLPTTNTPSSTFQPPNFNLDSQRKPIIPLPVPLLVSTTQPKDTVVNDPHSKEKLQILEDRLRAIEGHVLVRDVTDIKTPMELIFEELCKIGAIEKKRDSRKGAMCVIHPDAEHSIEKCKKFKEVLQSLIDSQLVQISCIRDERGVNVVQESENAQTQAFPKVPTPLTLHGAHNTQAPTCYRPRPITIQGNQVNPSIGPGAPAVTNISGVGGMNRSGRIYIPKELQEVKDKEMGKEKEKEGVMKKEERAPIVGPHLSKVSMMMAKTMLEKGYQHGQGLGNTMKGMVDVLRLYENKDKFGLGYKATPTDRKRVAEEKKVVVIEEEYTLASVHDAGILVYPCAPDTEINNCKIMEFPVILSSVSK